MPERPDLEYVVPILDRELRGRAITGLRVKKPVVMRVAIAGAPEAILEGRRFAAITRRAHFVDFALDTDEARIVVSPMLAGRFRLDAAGEKDTGDLAIAITLDDGRELRYRDDVQMGKVYVTRAGDDAQVPGLATIGVDVLDRKLFTKKRFREIAATRRDQVKLLLMDKGALDAMGNAYADEVLFEARIHPKSFVRALGDEDLDRLHAAIGKVLRRARDEIARRAPPLDEKVRDFLSVRGRKGDACPRCGAKIRTAGVLGHDAFFCPTCQPETRKSGIVDWRDLAL